MNVVPFDRAASDEATPSISSGSQQPTRGSMAIYASAYARWPSVVKYVLHASSAAMPQGTEQSRGAKQ